MFWPVKHLFLNGTQKYKHAVIFPWLNFYDFFLDLYVTFFQPVLYICPLISTDLSIIKGLGKVIILVVYAIWQIEYNWNINVYR